MRLALLVLLSGCGFEPSAATPQDAAIAIPDIKPDMSIPVTWSVDGASGRGVPDSAQQWNELIANNGLSISPPDGLWLMQETGGPLVPTIGTVVLSGSNTNANTYQHAVQDWTRHAIATTANQSTTFGNSSSSELPDVSSKSMMILLYYATPNAPTQQSSIFFGGSGLGYAEVGIDAADHFKLTANSVTNTGTFAHGRDVVPIVMKLDIDHAQQVLYVDHEKISGVNSPLSSSRGLLLAAAVHPDPEGRWLYMAAWYGASAEMTDTQVNSLLTALGW